MRSPYLLVLFFLSLAIQLIAISVAYPPLIYASKPLLLITLMAWFINSTGKTPVRNIFLAALALSLSGDILLLFQSSYPSFFIYGLVSFLCAHIFFIIGLNKLRLQNNILLKGIIIIPVALYYCLLIFILFPYLSALKIPVCVYGLVISTMLFCALHFAFAKNKAALSIVLGALLFVLSDSLLAFNKFYQPFTFADIAVILSYALAQFLIIRGVISYLDKA